MIENGMSEIIYLKIACPSCSNNIEFPKEMRGQIIDCPHCSSSITLELPQEQLQPPPVGNMYQRLRALNDLKPKNLVLEDLKPHIAPSTKL
jgi:DNA-directed RNA polymerase subunit RPC12/RpoP